MKCPRLGNNSVTEAGIEPMSFLSLLHAVDNMLSVSYLLLMQDAVLRLQY